MQTEQKVSSSLTDDEDQEGGGCHEAEVLGGASKFLSHVGFAAHTTSFNLLIG